jgi:SAM-dependent methyltransferase
MESRRAVRWAVLAVCLSLGAVDLYGQAQAVKKYEPSVGQAGKDVVWVPTAEALVEKMLDLAKVTPRDFVIDLGSGDGRTVIAAAKRGARAVGVEFNPEMVALSRDNAAAAGVGGKVTFVEGDLFETDLSQATVITMFLLPDINLRLRPKLLDLRPGTRIVSNSFTMDDWEADEEATVEGDCTSWCRALFWVVPAKVDGSWKATAGTLTLEQKFQFFTGTLGSTPITDGRLRGDTIEFTAGATHYTGRVNGASMKGTATGGSNGTWSAAR